MLKDVKWANDGTYSPHGEHKPLEFFSDALNNSYLFDLELGYFNSAAISVLSRSFATFIQNGGFMRLAINHIVSKRDKETIERGEEGDITLPYDLTDWDTVQHHLDEYGEQFFRCLAYLIQEKRIEIKIIKPKGTKGVAHTKRGQFSDGDMIVSFTGSANFTLGGFFNNREEISLSFSTSPDTTIQNRIENQRNEFSRLMAGTAEDVDYLSTSDLEEAVREKFGELDIEDLIDVEKKLSAYKVDNQSIGTLSDDTAAYNTEPCFPYATGPREYQKLAFENWKANGQKGLFAMATGTGKTITSLNCLLEIYKRRGYYKGLILVPTVTLVDQWEQECKKFKFSHIIKVCSKNASWKRDIDLLKLSISFAKEGQAVSYIIISTYASFARTNVFDLLNGFERTQLLLIADEAHNMGSPSLLKRLPQISYLRRIGLSATPERQFDDEENAKIFQFFGAESQYTYEYSMEEAIKNGVLCKYYYYPHIVHLTDKEMEDYLELSQKISKYFNFSSGTFDKKDDVLMALLLARKRIIHKAANKLEIFRRIIEERFAEKGNLKYTLVYVPEGLKPDTRESDVYDKDDQIGEDEDADRLIEQYTQQILEVDPYITVRKFVAGSKDREDLLRDFGSGKLQVLSSMKCLDEGVDVPRSEVAIFCSSTGNPRQFIQRRGRILRTHPDKKYAILHDLVVVPQVSYACDTYKMEQALLAAELKRVNNFATLSENPSEAQMTLNDIMFHYGLNLYNNKHILI